MNREQPRVSPAWSVTVRVPATTANLGSGFDSLGMALHLWNRFDVTLTPSCEREQKGKPFLIELGDVSIVGEGSRDLPTDDNNLLFRSVVHGLRGDPLVKIDNRQCHPSGPRYKMCIKINNKVPLSSGLGSSATAIVAGLLIANALRTKPFSKSELINGATRLEGHPDNVVAALLGGLVVCALKEQRTDQPEEEIPVEGDVDVEAITLPPPEDLWLTLAVPDFYVGTGDARTTLPARVTRSDAVFNLSRAALWVAAVATNNLDSIGTATEDVLHQPYRSRLIPGLQDVFAAAKSAGALGVALSGSGPSVAAFSLRDETDEIGRAMKTTFQKVGVTARIFTVRPSAEGASVQRCFDEEDGSRLLGTHLAGGL